MLARIEAKCNRSNRLADQVCVVCHTMNLFLFSVLFLTQSSCMLVGWRLQSSHKFTKQQSDRQPEVFFLINSSVAISRLARL